MARHLHFVALLISGTLFAGAAQAGESIAYSYDAKGRLVKVVHIGSANNNVQTVYAHDMADNRKNTTTTGSPNATPPP